MSLAGWLAPVRDNLAGLWITKGGQNLNLITFLGLPDYAGLVLGLFTAALALTISIQNKIGWSRLIFASGVGFSVALGWVLTYSLSQVAFEPVPVESATFSGPSANTLMFFLDHTAVLEFDIGLVPGVVIGSFLSALFAREFRFQGFSNYCQRVCV